MKRSKLNLVIDILLLLCTAAMVGVGLLMKFVLIPGYQRWEVYGSNVELFFWGMDRHQWGYIHYIFGLVFVGLLILHVYFHWSMVVSIYRNLIPNRIFRNVVLVLLIVITLAMLLLSFLVSPEVEPHEKGAGRLRSHFVESE